MVVLYQDYVRKETRRICRGRGHIPLIGVEQKVWSEHWDTKMVLLWERAPMPFVDGRAVTEMVWIKAVRERIWKKDAMGLVACARWACVS